MDSRLRHFEQLESIYRLSDAASRATDLEQVYREALDGLLRTLPVDRASVLLFDSDGVMRFKAWRGLSEEYRRQTEGHSPWSADAVDPEPVFVDDVEEEPSLAGLRDVIINEGIRALGFIPLVYQGRLLGKFMIYCDTPHQFTEEEAQVGRTIASHIAFAISRKRADEELAQLLSQVQDQRQRLSNIVATVPGIVWEAWGKPDESGQQINFVSDYVETMLGYSVEEWVSVPNFWLTIVHPDDKEEAARVATRHYVGGETGSNRFRWITKSGEVIWVEAHHVVIRGEDGNPIGMRGVTMDITERKLAEEERTGLLAREQAARREAEQARARMANLAEALDRALTEAELLNTIATSASGENELDLILSSALEHLSRVVSFSGGSIALVEGDALEVCAAVGPFAEAVLGQRLPRGDWKVWRVVEQREPFMSGDLLAAGLVPTSPIRSYLAVPLVWRGEAFGLLEIDSTEVNAFGEPELALMRKVAPVLSGPIELARRYAAEVQALALAGVAQRRLALLAEASSALVSSLDYEATLQSLARLVVPHLADMCVVDLRRDDGTTERVAIAHMELAREELVMDLNRRHPPEPGGPHPVAKVLRSGRSEVLAEVPDRLLRDVARDAEHYAILQRLGYSSLMVVPLVSRGRTLGAISFAAMESGHHFDKDDLALAEELARRAAVAIENARLYRQSQEAVRAREELLSIVTHDLKNPLGAVKVSSQLLQRRLANSGMTGMEWLTSGLTRIDTAATKMNVLIDELLDFARLQVGQPLDLERERVDLVALARQVAESAGTEERPRVKVEAETTELTGLWDGVRLERALANLISNALKYSPEESEVTIRISEERPDADGNAVSRWAVVAIEDRGVGIPSADLPHIFEWFRRAGNVAGHIRGTGVGLASVRQVVEQHGGMIGVQSMEGEGSTFTVRLPMGATSAEC